MAQSEELVHDDPARLIQHNRLNMQASFEPAGDQREAIAYLCKGITDGNKFQTLKGVTGSGKTFTMAKVIEQLQRPTLVLSHNKTLAAQLYQEFRGFFPDNAVGYFVSYYDYYQPEAYMPGRDLYIEKDASINDEIDKLRLSATANLYSRSDVIIVASVSCIYGMGNPADYRSLALRICRLQVLDVMAIRRRLVALQYHRNDAVLERGCFRLQGEVLDIYPVHGEHVYRVLFDWDTVQAIYQMHPITMEVIREHDEVRIFPAKHFVTTPEQVKRAVVNIRAELKQRHQTLLDNDNIVAAERLKSRTEYDLEMLEQMGYCNGIENYSMHLSGRKTGERPAVLLDYFPDDFLMFIDESHVTIPQIGAMYKVDKARKINLVDYGFRLPSAKDNRPLRFDEFESMIHQCVFVSATPRAYEMEHAALCAEQIIRPTGLLDPKITVCPTHGQIEDLVNRITLRIKNNERILITTLTKKMAEHLSDFLHDAGFKVEYLHSDIDTIERVEILTRLRSGDIHIIVGINLLREGLDLPEVSLVAILDADKIGFLRSVTSLIQTVGRAARNINGEVIMYADTTTEAMRQTIEETEHRRAIQQQYNETHNITPASITKAVKDILVRTAKVKKEVTRKEIDVVKSKYNIVFAKDRKRYIKELEKRMKECAENLDFEEASVLRDEIKEAQGSMT